MKYALLLLLVFSSLSAFAETAASDGPIEGEEIIPLGTDAYTPPPAKSERMLLRGTAQPELLAQERVGNRMASLTIPFQACGRGAYTLSALRLRFLTGPVLLSDATVYFANGLKQPLRTAHRFGQNTETGWQALPKANAKTNLCPRALVIRVQNANLTLVPASVQVFGLVGR